MNCTAFASSRSRKPATLSAFHSFSLLLAFALCIPAFAAPPARVSGTADPAAIAATARAWRTAHEREIVNEFMTLMAIPNLASDAANIEKNAVAIAAMLERRGVKTQLVREPGVPPLVVGDLTVPGATRTVAFYAHYDGQPVDASQWTSPPWSPVLRDASGKAIWNTQAPGASSVNHDEGSGMPAPLHLDPEARLYGRSAGDDKGTIIAMIAALDALQAAHAKPQVNVKFVYEGEEEAGSPHLPDLLQKHADVVRADAWFLCDGPVHQSRRMELFFGARGIAEVELTVYGPVKGLHDGHYGNWVPNPIVDLTHLIDSMRDTEANILIAGFYDDVLPPTPGELAALKEVPMVDGALMTEFGVDRTEGKGVTLNEQLLKPALNLRGISGGRVGATASNTINTEASASIDFRLVPNETPENTRAKVEAHLAAQGWFIVHDTPDLETRRTHPRVVRAVWGSGYVPSRTSMDDPFAKTGAAIVAAATGGPIVRLPTLGGSIPMYLFARGGVPVIGLPIANHDDNQHAANENLRLQNLWDGIEVYAPRWLR
jgi:acetylornithine deacetylase/succinyl-diaminopimelate desuccinylase-like protein